MRLTKHLQEDLSMYNPWELVYLTVMGLLMIALIISLVASEIELRSPAKHQEQEEYGTLKPDGTWENEKEN